MLKVIFFSSYFSQKSCSPERSKTRGRTCVHPITSANLIIEDNTASSIVMKLIDVGFNCLIPFLIFIHLLVAPYTKVEESFNLQATHDILTYGIPAQNIYETLRSHYDHFSFPGAVPRTFIGALVLAGLSKPLILFVGNQHAQLVVRASLGLFTSFALLRYKYGLAKAYGRDVGRWFILFQASQFHVIYYASRTLPNTFAFGLTTLALREFLPLDQPQDLPRFHDRQKRGISLLVFAAVVFRSEITILLGTQLLYLLIYPRISLELVVSTVLKSAIVSLLISILIDSYFWQSPILPELAGFYFNVIQGRSSDWGTSPINYYFTHALPKLLMNPIVYLVLIPIGLVTRPINYRMRELTIPSLIFIAIYSLQRHKEARFIIYVIPPLTAAASYAASYLWNRRSKGLLARLSATFLVISLFFNALTSLALLVISSFNYPGGHAISQLNEIITKTSGYKGQESPRQVHIHMDVLSCMTGVTRFLELSGHNFPKNSLTFINGDPNIFHYDKTEDQALLLQPDWWAQFDYALMEDPTLAIGSWETIATIIAYSGIEILRPGDMIDSSEPLKEFGSKIKSIFQDWSQENGDKEISRRYNIMLYRLMDIIRSLGFPSLIRNRIRLLTKGWWVGPRLIPRIYILKRLKD